MYKLSDLCDAYTQARGDYYARRDAVAALATTLLGGIEAYLQCPPLLVRFLSQSGEGDSTRTRSAEGMVWPEHDGPWHFRLGIELSGTHQGTRGDSAKQTAVIEVLAQAVDGGFSVGLKGWDDRFQLGGENGAAASVAFYDFVCERIIASYRSPNQRFSEKILTSHHKVGG